MERRGLTNAAKFLDLCDVALKDFGLCSLVETVKFRDVVDLDIVYNAVNQPRMSSDQYLKIGLTYARGNSLSKAGWTVTVVLSTFQILGIVELESFFQREIVEFATQCKLSVNFFLGNTEVCYVEEAWEDW